MAAKPTSDFSAEELAAISNQHRRLDYVSAALFLLFVHDAHFAHQDRLGLAVDLHHRTDFRLHDATSAGPTTRS